MKLKFFCPYWGSDHLPFDEFLQKVKDAGYDGVEMSFSFDLQQKSKHVEAIKRLNLEIIAQHWETIDADFDLHKSNYAKRLRNLAEVDPLFINSQTGKDYFTIQQNSTLIELAEEISKEFQVKIIHETHRGKFSFAAHVAYPYLHSLPSLKLCLDISHWCCVAETFLDDQREAVELAIQRTHHIHARVGHTEGPQVMDPRTDENKEILERHIVWWQRVVNRRKQDGFESFTITPEFGAPPYQHLFPNSQEPIYSQWDVNVFMMNLLKGRLS
jgi:sugar phosphate isomerase/epimerase